MQKIFEYLKTVVLKDSYYADCISFVDNTIYFRDDIGDQDPKVAYDMYMVTQEELAEFGITIIGAQVEHDCITGDIAFIDSRYVKQVIVIRKDLKMRRGKEIAQSCHASLAAVYEIEKSHIQSLSYQLWKNHSFTKIGLLVNSEEELLEVYNKAKDNGIPAALITDSGRTEFNGVATNTCVGIGPFWSFEVDQVTGHLKLY